MNPDESIPIGPDVFSKILEKVREKDNELQELAGQLPTDSILQDAACMTIQNEIETNADVIDGIMNIKPLDGDAWMQGIANLLGSYGKLEARLKVLIEATSN